MVKMPIHRNRRDRNCCCSSCGVMRGSVARRDRRAHRCLSKGAPRRRAAHAARGRTVWMVGADRMRLQRNARREALAPEHGPQIHAAHWPLGAGRRPPSLVLARRTKCRPKSAGKRPKPAAKWNCPLVQLRPPIGSTNALACSLPKELGRSRQRQRQRCGASRPSRGRPYVELPLGLRPLSLGPLGDVVPGALAGSGRSQRRGGVRRTPLPACRNIEQETHRGSLASLPRV